MSLRRTLAITKRIFRDLANDKRTLGLIFVAPIFAMFVFGWAFSGDVKDVPVIVVNEDEGVALPPTNTTISISEKIISNLDKEVLHLKYLDNAENAIQKVKDGGAYAAIILPESFTRNVYLKLQLPSSSGDTTVQVIADKSNINVANAIIRSVNSAVLAAMKDAGRESPITVDSENAIYGKNARFMDFFVPGIMAFVVFFLTTLLTLISFVGERTSGTLDRLMATPLKESELVLGYAITFSLIGSLQAGILLTVGISVFNITIVGNIMLAFVVIALLAVVSLSLGILLSSLAKREAQAIQFVPFIVLPTFLLAGIFWPVEAIPSWLRPASYFIPAKYAVEACRSVILRGWGPGKIWLDLVALSGFAAAFLSAAVWSLKRGRR